jgi:flagellar biogenesis protein FliO
MKDISYVRRRAPGPRAASWPCLLGLTTLALAVAAQAYAAVPDVTSGLPVSTPGATAASGVTGGLPASASGTLGASASASSIATEHTGGQAASGTTTTVTGTPTTVTGTPANGTPVPGTTMTGTPTPSTTVPGPAVSSTSSEQKSSTGTLGVADKPGRLPATLGAKDQDFSRLLWESMAAVLVIVILGAIAIVVVRRVMPRISVARGKRIVLRESLPLGPQKAVHLIQIGTRQILVGSSRDGVNMLADVTGALPASEEAADAAKPRKKFVIPPIDDAGDAGDAGKNA